MVRFALVLLMLITLGLLSPAPVHADGPPLFFVMDSFEATAGPDNYWTFSGHIHGWPPGTAVWVHLDGVVKQNCNVDEDGYFSCTVQLAADTRGTESAYGIATDGFGVIFTNVMYDTVD
jgi:hypothetical protein